VESMEVDGRTYSQKQARLEPPCAQQEVLPAFVTGASVERSMCPDSSSGRKQVEGCFSQPNGVMCQKMVSWAVDVTRGSQCVASAKPWVADHLRLPAISRCQLLDANCSLCLCGVRVVGWCIARIAFADDNNRCCCMVRIARHICTAHVALHTRSQRAEIQTAQLRSAWDLLELYCGNGNFTVPLAANFRRVVATEVSKASVVAAQHNMKVSLTDADAGHIRLSHTISNPHTVCPEIWGGAAPVELRTPLTRTSVWNEPIRAFFHSAPSSMLI